MQTFEPCDTHRPDQLTLEQAQARILGQVQAVNGVEWVSLMQARGRVLAREIVSEIDLPPFPNSSMDGYALRSSDVSSCEGFKVVGSALAGHPFHGPLRHGECIRIVTGAPIPDSADAVIIQEQVDRKGDMIFLRSPVLQGDCIRPRGDDVKSGQLLLEAGQTLSSLDVALLAAIGRIEVEVYSVPRVAFLSTGDELRPVWSTLGEGEIHDSNRYLIGSLLAEMGILTLDLGTVPDNPEALKRVLLEAANTADAIITTGGASVGDADYLVEVLSSIGRTEFWKVAIKPGKPFAFGKIGRTWLFGLPGNPAAVAVTFKQLVYPALTRLMGSRISRPLRIKAVAECRLTKKAGRLEFRSGLFYERPDGSFAVKDFTHFGSHRLGILSQANCFIVLPLENNGFEQGDIVEIEPFQSTIQPA